MRFEITENIYSFEKEIIMLNKCPSILKVSVIKVGDKEEFIYDTEGHIEFDKFQFVSVDQFLEVLYKIIFAIYECEDFLLKSKKLLIDKNSIFINPRTYEIKLVFGSKNEDPLLCKLRELLESQLDKKEVIGISSAIQQIINKMAIENPGLKGLMRIVEEVRREWQFIQPN